MGCLLFRKTTKQRGGGAVAACVLPLSLSRSRSRSRSADVHSIDDAIAFEGQQQAVRAWKKIRPTIDSKESAVVWDAHLVKCMDASFDKVENGGWEL